MGAFLFQIEDGVVVPTVEALLIKPFCTIWERDLTEHKTVAKLEFSFIEFMTSKKASNPYKGYDDTVRAKHILIAVPGYDDQWKPDDLVTSGMDFITNLQKNASPTYNFYTSAFKAARKLQDFFNTFDINETNVRSGNPIWKPADITRPLKETPEILDTMRKLEKKVEEDVYDKVITKANKDISPFAERPNN